MLTLESFAFLNCTALKNIEISFSNITLKSNCLGYTYDYTAQTYGSTGLTIRGYVGTPAHDYYLANNSVVRWVPIEEIWVRFNPSPITMKVGETVKVSLETNAPESGITLKGFDRKDIESFCTIKTDDNYIYITGKSVGSATFDGQITYKGTNYYASTTVTVTDPPSIHVSQKTVEVEVAKSVELTFTTTPEGQTVTLNTEKLTNAMALKPGPSSRNVVTVAGKTPGTSSFDLVMVVDGKTYTETITVIVKEPSVDPDACKYCGEVHGGLFGWLVQIIHNILFAIFGAK